MARIIITPAGVRFEGKNFEEFAATPVAAKPVFTKPAATTAPLLVTVAANGVVEKVLRLN